MEHFKKTIAEILRGSKKHRLLKVPPTKFGICNQPECNRIEISPEGWEAINGIYHDIRGQPGFMDAILHVNPASSDVRLLKKCPELIEWSPDGQFVLIPNLPYTDAEKFMQNRRHMRETEEGFAMSAWYVHPKQLENTVFSTPANRQDFNLATQACSYDPRLEPQKGFARGPHQEVIRQIENETGIPYLASILDLKREDVTQLKALKRMTLTHLKKHYNVSDNDYVCMFFHNPVALDTTTLHMHIRVNQGMHPMEASQRFTLDEIISTLEKGKPIAGLVESKGPIFSHDPKLDFLREIPGIQISRVANDFIQACQSVAASQGRLFKEHIASLRSL